MSADRMSPLDAIVPPRRGRVSATCTSARSASSKGRRRTTTTCSAMVAGKLPLVPRYRQNVRFVPFQLGRPVWVDDPDFNIAYHIRHTALPKPAATTSCATSSVG